MPGLDFLIVLETVVFLLFPLLFFVIYLLFSSLAKEISGGERPDLEIAKLVWYTAVTVWGESITSAMKAGRAM